MKMTWQIVNERKGKKKKSKETGPNTAKVQRSERMKFVQASSKNESICEEWFHSQACGSRECRVQSAETH